MRYAARVEYDGAGYSGWQAQKHNVRTVQGIVESALAKVADHPISIITAGRTDAGVHATHQVIHFDSTADRSNSDWCRGGNRFMDHDARLHWVCPVDNEFHARFSAVSRSYRFVILNSKIAPAINRAFVTPVRSPLNVELMREAGRLLLGEHDFSSFRAAGCQAHSPIRTVSHFELATQGQYIWFDVCANAFLQHMVRNIAGSLIEVGSGKRSVDWFSELLVVRDRTLAGITAVPNGLYLTGVDYPANYQLPSNRALISFWNEQ